MTEPAQQIDRPFLDFPDGAPPLAKAPALPLPAIPLRDGDPLEILRVVAQSYSLAPQQIIGKLRLKSIAEARQVTCWLLRTRTKLSSPECARVVNKDHTSVLTCVKRCIARRAKDPGFEAFTDQLAAAVEARLKGEVAA